MKNQIHGACQRMADNFNKAKEKYTPIAKEKLIKISESLTKTEVKKEKEKKVLRFCPKDKSGGVNPPVMMVHKFGAYVLYEDYVKLQEKYNFLKEHPGQPLIDWLDETAEYARTEMKKIEEKLKKKK